MATALTCHYRGKHSGKYWNLGFRHSTGTTCRKRMIILDARYD